MPPKKVTKRPAPRGMNNSISPGLIITDLMEKQWKLGPVIGQGAFGYIYLGALAGSGVDVTSATADYVIKVEPHANGPLFVELAFYQRVAKAEIVNTWMKNNHKSHLGIPLYIGSGLFDHASSKYRFMVINRFGTDVEKLYKQSDYCFPEATVYSLGLRIVDALEYIHDNEYVHADIKSSNLMMGYKKGDMSKVYLLDYGLAYRFNPGGTHVSYKEDPKRKHDGTIEYTSRDAHKGCAPSRRGDMEILGYCMIQWLCKKLPWEDKLQDKEYVFQQKEKYMGNLKEFMSKCFTGKDHPDKLKEYMELVNKMDYSEKPDYEKIRKLFLAGLKQKGVSDDGKTIRLPTAKTLKVAGDGAASPKKPKTVLKDKNAIRKPSSSKSSDVELSTKKRAKSPVKKYLSPVKRIKSDKGNKMPLAMSDSDGSPVKQTKAAVAVRRSPRNVIKTSYASSDDDDEHVQKGKGAKKAVNGAGSCGDRIMLIDGVEKTVHRRLVKRNIPTRDFAQSP